MNAIGDVVTRGVAAGNFESRRGNICGEDFGVREFHAQRNGEAAGARADVGDAQSLARRSGVHVNLDSALAEALERDFHDVLGFRAGNQHRGSDFEFEAPEFLFAGEILRRLACGAPRDRERKISRRGWIERFFGMAVEPSAIAAERVHQQQFGGERVRRNLRRAQLRHAFFQSGANIHWI